METDTYTSTASLLAGYTMPQPTQKKRTNERTELVRYFYENAVRDWEGRSELKPARIAYKLSHLSLLDLYAFKSMCEDRVRNGYPFGKFFWGSLKIK